MRPIDADAVLDRYYAEYERQDICDGAEDREWLMKCLNEAPTLTPPNEWVSVDEKLPDEELKRFKELFPEENEVEVLVMIQWAYTATTLYWDGEKFYDEMRSYEVTHWMPLPAPPDRRPPVGEANA